MGVNQAAIFGFRISAGGGGVVNTGRGGEIAQGWQPVSCLQPAAVDIFSDQVGNQAVGWLALAVSESACPALQFGIVHRNRSNQFEVIVSQLLIRAGILLCNYIDGVILVLSPVFWPLFRAFIHNLSTIIDGLLIA